MRYVSAISGGNIKRAKVLRKEMTRQERKLWFECLQAAPLRFQRQKAVGSYIVDFYCHRAKLVIEVDGGQHFEPAGYLRDGERDKYLSGLGLRILRFSNAEINTQFQAVCNQIYEEIRGSLSEGAVGTAD